MATTTLGCASNTALDSPSEVEHRNQMSKKELEREILLSVWKIHILHHAAHRPVIGQWIIRELRHHGYEVSPGTIYPLLARMERRGWLACHVDMSGGLKARREYTLTSLGHEILEQLRTVVRELHHEVIEEMDEEHDPVDDPPKDPQSQPSRR